MKLTKRQKPIFAKRSLGQNFLVDETVIGKIIDAVNPRTDEMIIEIGPGRGALTERLLASGATVIAIELDRYFVPMLRERFADSDRFEVLEEDALQIDFGRFANPESLTKLKLAANLPYNISTAILQRLIDYRHLFSELTLMLQREVVDRITAKPGDSERSFLTVLVEQSFDSEKLFDVSPDAFRPAPKVFSSVVKLMPKSREDINDELLREILSIGFQQKRKTILNNLKNKFADAGKILESANIDASKRAEDLSTEDWLRILNVAEGLR